VKLGVWLTAKIGRGRDFPRPPRRFNWSVFAVFLAARGLLSLALFPLVPSLGSQDSSAGAIPNGSKIVFSEDCFAFGQVLSGTVVEHDFTIYNRGSVPVAIEKVSMTPPLLVTRMPRQVASGEEGKIHFKLDTANLEGEFKAMILVSLNDPALPETQLTFTGRIVPAIELFPSPAFFVAGQRGKGKQASIEIANHESEPLTIDKIEESTARFTTQLETLIPGQRYRLTLSLNPNGPVGRASDTILLRTSSKRIPVLNVTANTYLYQRVHAFPDHLDFGSWRVGDATSATAILMIYQEGGKDFEARLSTDIPGLSLRSERGPVGDRYQTEVTLRLEGIPIGLLKGSIFIDTNDKQFPRIIVPVRAQIVQR
jgi:hypothetical protein